jgi:hypothetical protein
MQLHILYLTTVITLLLLPWSCRNSRTCAKISFVAASCIARLYEDIDCHEEVHRLLPHNGWMLTVAAIPQIYHASRFPNAAYPPAHDLDILTAVVLKITNKHASAKMVLRKINAFRTKLEGHPAIATAPAEGRPQNALNEHESSQIEHLNEVFQATRSLLPFPESHCQSIRLLKDVTAEDEDLGAFDTTPFDFDLDAQMDWSVLFDEAATQVGGLDSMADPLAFAALIDG